MIVPMEFEIINISKKLFLSYGLKSISMDDICKKMGISKKTLYQYIPTKAKLVEKVVLHRIQEEQAAVSQIINHHYDAVEEYINIGRHIVKTLREMKPTVIYDLQKYYPNEWKKLESLQVEFMGEVIGNNISRGKEEDLYRANVDASIISKLYISKSLAIVDELIFPLQKYSKDELFKEFVRYHIYGIASKKGLKRLEQLVDQL